MATGDTGDERQNELEAIIFFNLKEVRVKDALYLM
jgi:hypothetical protein